MSVHDDDEAEPFIASRSSVNSDGGNEFILEDPPTTRDFVWPCLGLSVMLALSILIITTDGGANSDDIGIESGLPPTVLPPGSAVISPKPAAAKKAEGKGGLGNKKVFVVGLPKAGTSSIQSYFECGGNPSRWLHVTLLLVSHCSPLCDDLTGVKASHWKCGDQFCADCIKNNVDANRDPLKGCGEFQVFTQMDRESPPAKPGDGGLCYFPQIEALEALHEYHPDAVLVLNIRPAKHWLESISNWGDLKTRLTRCDVSTKPAGTPPDADWYHAHLALIRAWVAQHPTHKLVELHIEDPKAFKPHFQPKFNPVLTRFRTIYRLAK